jgi:hypothetical protein
LAHFSLLSEFPAGLRDGAWAGLLLSINR